MLGEAFLRVLPYREERKANAATKPHRTHTHSRRTEPPNGGLSCSNLTLHTQPAASGPYQREPSPTKTQGHNVLSPAVVGLSIPGSSPILHLDTDHSLDIDDCSFLQKYPDLTVGDSGWLSHSPPRGAASQFPPQVHLQGHPGSQGETLASISDQGYMVMGASVNISLGLPGSGLEPMSNSLLNGLLEKQLEEVYMQHLTDNLARCHSHLGNSLLHHLVPPPQPSSSQHGLDSLEAGLDDALAGSGQQISYLHTHNLGVCSSNFSSPVLRISEAETVQQPSKHAA